MEKIHTLCYERLAPAWTHPFPEKVKISNFIHYIQNYSIFYMEIISVRTWKFKITFQEMSARTRRWQWNFFSIIIALADNSEQTFRKKKKNCKRNCQNRMNQFKTELFTCLICHWLHSIIILHFHPNSLRNATNDKVEKVTFFSFLSTFFGLTIEILLPPLYPVASLVSFFSFTY